MHNDIKVVEVSSLFEASFSSSSDDFTKDLNAEITVTTVSAFLSLAENFDDGSMNALFLLLRSS